MRPHAQERHIEDIVAEVAAATGLPPETARQAIGIIIAFLAREGPQQQVRDMIARMPGAQELADQYGGSGRGLLGVFNDLSSAGLGFGEVQGVARAFLGAARQRVGAGEVDAVLRGVPGLSQFV